MRTSALGVHHELHLGQVIRSIEDERKLIRKNSWCPIECVRRQSLASQAPARLLWGLFVCAVNKVSKLHGEVGLSN